MISLYDLIDYWELFFFTYQSSSTIAIFRIFFGGLLIINGLLLLREATIWYGESGFIAYEDYKNYAKIGFSLFKYLPPTNCSAYIVLIIYLLSSLLLTIGLFTQISAFIVFISLVSLSHRNPFINHSGDSVLRIMCFLLIFSSAGHGLSVDQYLFSTTPNNHLMPSISPQWCLRLMQIQVSVIYLRAFFHKIVNPVWRNGSALYYPTQLKTYQRFSNGQLFQNKFIHKFTAWSVLFVQLLLGVFIWIEEFRYPILLLGIIFHLGIEYFLNVQLFGWTMIVCLLLFVDPDHFDILLKCIFDFL